MLPAPLVLALPLLAQTALGSVAAPAPSEALACDSGLASRDGGADADNKVDSNLRFPVAAENDQAESKSKPKNRVQPHGHPNNHVPARGHPKVHVPGRVVGSLQPPAPATRFHPHVHAHERGRKIKAQAAHSWPARPFSGKLSSSQTRLVVSANTSAAPSRVIAPVRTSSYDTEGFKNGLYFTNWRTDESEFDPESIAERGITHAIYAFARVNANGIVEPSNPWLDVQKYWKTDAPEPGLNAYGYVKRMYMLKKQVRHVKTLLSVGGWAASQTGNFSAMASTDEGRRAFAVSAVKLVMDWGMDGLDIDWESPRNATEARQYVQLLQLCRQALDEYAMRYRQPYHYLLTAATSAGQYSYNIMDLAGMDKFLDIWNVMSYDLAGTWDPTTGHQANVYAAPGSKIGTHQAVTDYLAAGINPRKISIGLPLYGRSFAHAKGPGSSFNGSAAPGEGTRLYRDLPQPGAKVEYDSKLIASWSYDDATGEFVSYDNLQSTRDKARYIQGQNLGGAFFWEASGDKPGRESLVYAMAASLDAPDNSENMLDYPGSAYDNIRNRMGDTQRRGRRE